MWLTNSRLLLKDTKKANMSPSTLLLPIATAGKSEAYSQKKKSKTWFFGGLNPVTLSFDLKAVNAAKLDVTLPQLAPTFTPVGVRSSGMISCSKEMAPWEKILVHKVRPSASACLTTFLGR